MGSTRIPGIRAKDGLTIQSAMRLLGEMQDALNERDYGLANALRDEMHQRFLTEVKTQVRTKSELMEIAMIVEMTNDLGPMRG